MSILGKILAFLNILGVGGLIYLGSVTYAKRRAWEYVNFRHDLLADNRTEGTHGGLSIDDQDSDKAGNPLVKKFAAKPEEDRTLKELLGGKPLKTQREEVERVKKELDGKLSAKDDNIREKNILLADIVMPLVGSDHRQETYVDREFYLSMKAQLGDDKKFTDFKKALVDAFPIAASAVRFKGKSQDNRDIRTSFEKAFQQALNELPGEDKWKLAEAFLNKLQDGGSWAAAAEAADQAATEVETKAKAVPEALQALDTAAADAFVARAVYLSAPNRANEDDMNAKEKVRQQKQADYKKAEADADKLAKPRDAAALAFLKTIRKDTDKDKTVAKFVDEVVDKALEDVRDDLTRRYQEAYDEAANGKVADSSQQLTRERRQQAIARFLFAGLEVLDTDNNKDFNVFRDGEREGGGKINSMVDLPSFKRFVNVVGIKEAIGAVNNQQLALAAVIEDVNGQIGKEKMEFRDRHNKVVLALKDRAQRVDGLAARLKDITEEANNQEKIASAEKERVDAYVKDLTDSREETGKAMADLEKQTGGLNTVRIAIRDAIRANEINLRKIADLEYEILYLQQKLAEKEKAEKDKKRNRAAP
jgi:hypothetical protein